MFLEEMRIIGFSQKKNTIKFLFNLFIYLFFFLSKVRNI